MFLNPLMNGCKLIMKLFCGQGLTYTFFTSRTEMCVQKGRGKAGLSGNILVKSNISKSKCENVFDIREDYSLYIQNMRKIHLLGFPI